MQLHNDAQAEFDRLAANPVRPGLPDAGALSAGTAEILVMTSTGMPDSAIAHECLGDLDRRAGDEAGARGRYTASLLLFQRIPGRSGDVSRLQAKHR